MMELVSSEDQNLKKELDSSVDQNLNIEVNLSKDQQIILDYDDDWEKFRFVYTPTELNLNSIRTVKDLCSHLEKRWHSFRAAHVQRCEVITSGGVVSSSIRLHCAITPPNEEEAENTEEQDSIRCPTGSDNDKCLQAITNEEQVDAENTEEQDSIRCPTGPDNDKRLQAITNEEQVEAENAEEQVELNHKSMKCPTKNYIDKGRRPKGMCRSSNCLVRKGRTTIRRGTTTWICLECQCFLHPQCFDEYHKNRNECLHRHARLANRTVHKIIGSKAKSI